MVYFVDSRGCVQVSNNVPSVQKHIAYKRAKTPLCVKRIASQKEAKAIIRDWVAANS